jgi:2-dehydropantoate 2-reductase
MSGDIELGRTEVDNFNGHLLKIAGDGPCPLNRAAVTLVNRMAATRICFGWSGEFSAL